jgi:hypothetical protein
MDNLKINLFDEYYVADESKMEYNILLLNDMRALM